jgi:uncharacterized membrane protein
MSELIAIVYPAEHRAREVVQTLRKLESAHFVDLEDARYATKDAKGWVEVHQSINPQARGAVEITDAFMCELTHDMENGRSAMFVLVHRATVERFVEELAKHGGNVLHTSLSHAAEAKLRTALRRTQKRFPTAKRLAWGLS